MCGDEFDELELFQSLNIHQRALVSPLFVPCDYQAGDVLFSQGEQAEYLYLVARGEVAIQYKPEDGPVLIVARVHCEGIVGWSAVLGSPIYTSSSVCSTDCRLLRVRGADLRSLCEEHPETGHIVLEHLAEMIAIRLRNTHEHVIALLQQGLQLDLPAFNGD